MTQAVVDRSLINKAEIKLHSRSNALSMGLAERVTVELPRDTER